jgi:sec-independent protein translocase protein TatB
MEIFNIGPLELVFILIIALIVLGPENMVKSARGLGKWIYKLVRSPMWATLINTSRELREFPEKLVREAGIDESLKEIRDASEKVKEGINISVDPINIGPIKVDLPLENTIGKKNKDGD